MARLSSSIEHMKSHYTVVVIGSGYGGGIAASRLARAGQTVCVLERGKEWQAGDFPDTPLEGMAELQTHGPDGHTGSRTGLYDLRVNDDVNVLVGCGLGGTSLINANASIEPEPAIWNDPKWPKALRNDQANRDKGYQRARAMLKPTAYPEGKDSGFPPLLKTDALKKSANHLSEQFTLPDINVTFEDGPNHVGVPQQACKLCGDCVSGCNHRAKNTVDLNYLPDAKNHGAKMFTEVSVRHLTRDEANNRWIVHYEILNVDRDDFGAPNLHVSADIVILAAGSLGSTEILLRSKAQGLSLSDKIGHGFTSNGDVWGFGYNNDQPINGIGFGHDSLDSHDPVGPCITGLIDARHKDNLEDGIVIEDGTIPGALSGFLPATFGAAASIMGKDTDSGILDATEETLRVWSSKLFGPYHGAIHHTQTYLVMGNDDGNGQLTLEQDPDQVRPDRLRVDWPGYAQQKTFEITRQKLEKATEALGGTYMNNPTEHWILGNRGMAPHPLGGCNMAEDAGQGVVNHKGQVFSSSSGTSVYDGLYVNDGAIIPRSLGVNPLLTISALAERACMLVAQDRGWSFDDKLPSSSHPPSSADGRKLPLGLQSTERMSGYFSANVTKYNPDQLADQPNFQNGAKQGELEGSSIEFVLTLATDNLDAVLADPEHTAKIVGTVKAPTLSPHPLTVNSGQFNLFSTDQDQVETKNMWYRMNMTTQDGQVYYFEGYKVIRDDPGFDLWEDATTLYTTVYQGSYDIKSDAPKPTILGKGILTIDPFDYMTQLQTIEVRNAESDDEDLGAQIKFARFFYGDLYDIYGGILSRPSFFDPDAPPRKTRPLRVGAPEVHFFTTADSQQLRLTRYQGGTKGPVMLVHGLGVSSLIFSLDTIETNLLEYLYAHGYDVWLLDWRGSIEVDGSNHPFTGDQVAEFDHPAAVNKVLEITKAPDLQVVAHCVGSITFFMSLLKGHVKGVRSLVSSQVAMHYEVPLTNRIKAGLFLPTVLDTIGVDSLTAYTDTNSDWKQNLFNMALRWYPLQKEEKCQSPVCHRITFMYGLLWEHDKLNDATHETLHETFGGEKMKIFKHLALLARSRHMVTADEVDDYITGANLNNLKFPITFIHGEENETFLPKSTKNTFEFLCKKNGKELYRRQVIPDYGHIDCIFGKNAVNDVYPYILNHLEKHDAPGLEFFPSSAIGTLKAGKDRS
jgi:cholesterol oxidase